MRTMFQRDVFVDLCVQREYLGLTAPRRCHNATQVTLSVKHLMAFARLAKVPVLSCIDVDRGNRIGSEYVSILSRENPRQQKAAFSLLPHHTIVESDNSLCVSLEVLRQHQQAVFTKVHRDPFTNPKLDRLLTEMPAERFVAFGVPLETSLRILVLGLIRRKRRVALLTDACGFWNRQEADMVLRQIGVKGCELITTDEYLAGALARIRRRLGIRVRRSRSVA